MQEIDRAGQATSQTEHRQSDQVKCVHRSERWNSEKCMLSPSKHIRNNIKSYKVIHECEFRCVLLVLTLGIQRTAWWGTAASLTAPGNSLRGNAL
jgi:hypothetical protein